MEETSRMDIRRLLKTFGVQADESIIAHMARNPDRGPWRIRLTLEDLTDYGDRPPQDQLHLVIEGDIREK